MHPDLSRFGPLGAPVAGLAFWVTTQLQRAADAIGLGRLVTLR